MRLLSRLEINFDLGKLVHMFERKGGAGNEHAGSYGILGREEMKMTEVMSLFLLSFEVRLLMTNFVYG